MKDQGRGGEGSGQGRRRIRAGEKMDQGRRGKKRYDRYKLCKDERIKDVG